MEKLKIYGKKYMLFGKVRGHQKDKWNRATKLAYRFEELDKKFRGIVERGAGLTEHARCALALLLMMQTGIRVGNESSAEGYMTKPHPNQKDKVPEFVKTYGLTTMLPEHVIKPKKGLRIEINFVGKKQVENNFTITDKFLVTWLSKVKDFSVELNKVADKYEMSTETVNRTMFGITDYMLTKFIKKYVGSGFSPKDFRCMKGNLLAWEHAQTINWGEIEYRKDFKPAVKRIYEKVSELLNNTPGVVKKSYVCPKLELHLLSKTLIQ